MRQISLPFDWSGGQGDGDFLASEANALAVRHLDSWRDWPVMITVLTGPPLSGRSTLGRHFAQMSGGELIDDAEGTDEHHLFHAWNRAQTDRVPLLLIGQSAPTLWTIALPDLRSRLAAVPHVAIAEPDEVLAHALVERQLSRAGAPFVAELPDWLLRRIERTYGAIAAVTRLLNEAALSSGRKISVAMAKEALQNAGILPILPPEPNN
ncbi:chromosomal replication initiator DnaA [Sphingobium aromaticiconvertens]|uniref:chromosomal replication initiator DnaA n=1 Tax=Sphingobium aromaticiconvertens TaxID=365341 RepID=UPI0030186D21